MAIKSLKSCFLAWLGMTSMCSMYDILCLMIFIQIKNYSRWIRIISLENKKKYLISFSQRHARLDWKLEIWTEYNRKYDNISIKCDWKGYITYYIPMYPRRSVTKYLLCTLLKCGILDAWKLKADIDNALQEGCINKGSFNEKQGQKFRS